METVKVVIVRAGGFGELSAEAGSYDQTIETLRSLAKRVSADPAQKITVEIEVCPSVDAAMDAVQRFTPVNSFVTVVFLTRGMLQKARALKEALAQLGREEVEVVLLTGLFPKDEVVLLNKNWLDLALVRKAIFQHH